LLRNPSNVDIIPVMDVRGGLVVRARAGRRAEYQPLCSRLCPDSRPLTLAESYRRALGLAQLYLADLDAIAGHEPDWDLYGRLLHVGVQLWVDAGVADLRRAEALAQLAAGPARLHGVIVGLESLPDVGLLEAAMCAIGPQRLVFSLDLRAGVPITRVPRWHELPPPSLLREILACGVRRWIVLDLADVGMGSGVGTLPLCRQLREASPDAHITTGGGVRDLNDLQLLQREGIDAALVASALHDGGIGPDDLAVLRQG
jgi:phosphoribosylformimino-5-aminoimidazole carboxamide ribotide isomerase